MKTFTFNRHLLLLCLLLFASLKIYAQRIYATSQQSAITGTCVLCGVVNAPAATDGNLQSFSTLTVTVGLGATVRQELIFPAGSPVPANTPVTIKLGSGNKLVDVTVLGGILLQAYNGATAIGAPVTASTLISAVSSNNETEVIFTPGQNYDRVRVTLDAGLLGAAGSVDVYDAFYGSGPGPCNTAIDEIHGISSTILGLGVNLGGVANPARAIDGDITTFSTLNAGVAVASSFAQQTVIYGSPSVIGDSVRVTFAIGQALINASVLTGTSVSTYLGNTSNNDSRTLNSTTLTVRLLDLGGNRTKVIVTFVPQNIFDRVQLRLGGGIASVLSTLDLYEIEHVLPKPVVTVNNVAVTSTQVCSGTSATLTATAVPNTVFNWYATATGGAPIFTGQVFTTPALTATTIYYVAAMRNGCTDASQRTVDTVKVNPLPIATVIAGANSAIVCSGQTATFTAQANAGITVRWYTSATGGTPVFTGNTFTTPILTTNINYFAEAVNASGCAAATRTQVSVTVQPTPAVAVLSAANIAVNSGQTATITVTNAQAGVTYNWYTVPTGGTIIFTGTTYTTPALTANATYYVEGVLGTCTSPSRAQVTVVVNAGPDVTVVPATQAVNPGQTAVFTATSTTPNATFNWYTTATGGTPVFTGPTFTTPPIAANTTYYAEAVNPVTNAVSPTRASGSVTVNAVSSTPPTVAVTPATQAVNAGQTAMLTASSTTAGAVFNWYTTPTGGTAVFTGANFTTPPVNGNTTYYAEAKDPVSGVVSSTRASGAITVNGGSGTTGPDVAVTPPTQSVNPGQTAIFMASSTTPGQTFNWYTTPTGGSPIFTGATFTTPPITSNTTYYAEAKDPVSGAASAVRATGKVTVNSVAPDVAVTPATQAVNSGQTANLTASSTTAGAIFNWYTAPTGGTSVFTGAMFTTPPINGNITYYADAKDPVSGLVSTTRASGAITVNGGSGTTGPDVAVTPPTQAVNSGQTAMFVASSTTPGQNFNWYTTPAGGVPVFTGATFITPPITANTTYYAEAQNPVSGAVSPTRATGMVTVNTITATPPNVAVTPPTQAVNAGQTATLTASSTTAGSVFNWYTAPTGGSSVFTGATFTTPSINGDVTYYAEAKDPATNAVSATRAAGAITVNGGSGVTGANVTVTPPTQAVNPGQTAVFTASSTTPGQNFNWYTTPTGGSPIFTGATYTTPPITANTTFYAEAQDPISGAVSPVRATGTVTVNSIAPDVTVTPATQAVNAGQTATLTASSTTAGAVFNWYTTPTGGTSIFTGATFTTPSINGNITYYAEAKNPATGAVSSTRATGMITVNGGTGTTGANVTVIPPTQAVNPGQTATFTASSTTPGQNFNWYTTPTGGTPVFTGATYTTPPITANTTFYAEASDPVSGATSPTRATGMVTLNSGATNPDVAVTPPTRAVNTGQTATFTASSTTPGEIFNWYTTPTGGTPIFTGATFTTPPVNGNITYYAEAKDPVSGNVSTTRATAAVTVNPVPNVAVTPPKQAVNTGQTATFTASSTTPGEIFSWYTTPTEGAPIFTGTTFTTPPVTGNVVYYAEAKDPVTGAVSTTRATGTVSVNPAPGVAVTPPTQSVNTGQTATFTATSTTPGEIFNWYTTPTGGTPIFTGATFTTPPVTGNVIYYAEAKDPITGAVSTTRATGTVAVNPAPDITVTPPVRTINKGATATFTASSTTPGATFTWYTSLTGGVPVFTGATFITPIIAADVIYYAEAKNPVTGAISLTRASATITLDLSSDGIYVPNAFTPNNDGKNDLLYVYSPNIKSLKLSVYDQWGELQFQSTSQANGWDGTYKGRAQPVGVYVYYIEAVMNDSKIIKKKGTITLLR